MTELPPSEFDEGAPAAAPAPVPWRGRDAIPLGLLELSLSFGLILLIAEVVAGNLQLVLEIAVTEIVLGLSVIGWVRIRHGLPAASLGLERPTRALVLRGVGAGLAGIALAHLIVGPLTLFIADLLTDAPMELPAQIEFRRPEAGVVALTGVAVIVLAPLAEELFFRGFLFRGLRKGLPLWAAVAVSAVIFGLVHAHPLIIPSIAALGVVLALEVERAGSLVPAIVGHAVFNVSGFLFLLLDGWT